MNVGCSSEHEIDRLCGAGQLARRAAEREREREKNCCFEAPIRQTFFHLTCKASRRLSVEGVEWAADNDDHVPEAVTHS